jgi:aspartyl-tRNA(Asn)/glutamyl-tRNA(Gln) amidotransferase subunit A
VPTNYFNEDVQPAVAGAVANAIEHLESLGAKAIPVAIGDLDGVLDCMLAILLAAFDRVVTILTGGVDR